MYYQDVENLRKQKKYILYLYSALDERLSGDEFDISLTITKYSVFSNRTGRDKEKFVNGIYNVNYYENAECPFYKIESILKRSNQPQYLIKNFRRIMLLKPDGSNDIIQNIGAAMACFEEEAIINDIIACRGDLSKLWEVLKTLSLEANAVALNGAFSRLFDTICRAGKRSKGDFRRVNSKLEKMIIDIYNKILFGERPIVIDEDVYRDAPIITRLNSHLKKVYNKRNLTDQQLIDEIIQPFADILFTDFSVIDINEFDI